MSLILDGRQMTDNEIIIVRRLRALKSGINKLDSREPDRGHGALRVEITAGWETLIKHEYSESPKKRC